MEWQTKILKDSSHKGRYHGRFRDDRTWAESHYSNDGSSDFDREEIDCAIALSISEVHQKGKMVIGEEDEYERCVIAQLEEEQQQARARQEEDERRARAQQEEDERRAKAQLEEDEQLAKAIQESLSVQSRPQYDNSNIFQPPSFVDPSGNRICAGCNTEIGHGQCVSWKGAVWHPECFHCHACNLPITDTEFSTSRNRPYHKHCYKEQHHPKCNVCHNFIPTNSAARIDFGAHPFWLQQYCPSHERDGTPLCCSCERMEPRDAGYLSLDDGRKLCLECLDSAIMDTQECQPLYREIQEFYEGLNMKVEQQVPLLLVERQALNAAMEGEKNGHHHLPETRGLCLFEGHTVTRFHPNHQVQRGLRISSGYRPIDRITKPYGLIRRCEVTAIIILYGLPRLLTGSTLAHEMMHAWLGLKGYPNLRPEVEEGICQVLAHMWLESEICSSSTSSSSSSSSTSSKKGQLSDIEKELGRFYKHLIESDTSSAYGDGFREGNKAVKKYGLRKTLNHIQMTGSFPL